MNVILKGADGRPLEGELMGGMQSYQISYAQEWRTGLAQRRIDELSELLPELIVAGTVHIDAFHSVQPVRPSMQPARPGNDQLSSPYLGITTQDEIAAQRKIIRYWRRKGVDVTSEDDTNHLKPDPFIGLQPMAWWFDPQDFLVFDWFHKPANFIGLPATLFVGTPMHAEEEIKRDPVHLTGLAQQFCEKVVPWYYANSTAPKEEGFNWTPNEHGVFIPALWRPATVVACTMAAMGPHVISDARWRLPQSWGKVDSVKVMEVTVDGLKPLGTQLVQDGLVELTLRPGNVIAIEK
jgi:hypothetical protein